MSFGEHGAEKRSSVLVAFDVRDVAEAKLLSNPFVAFFVTKKEDFWSGPKKCPATDGVELDDPVVVLERLSRTEYSEHKVYLWVILRCG